MLLPFAPGREATTTLINVSGAGDSSSLLDMLPSHTDAVPGTDYIGEQRVEVKTLDEVFDAYDGPADVGFLKMDVQGYEQHVLDGAERSLDRLVGLQVELSLVPLYDGETLFAEMIAQLEARGFSPVGVEPGLRNAQTKQLLQMDGLFFRTA